MRNVTKLIGDRVANDRELARVKERSERMERYVEVLESEIEEQDRLRQEASRARHQHQSAAAAFARGVKASEEATLERAARQLGDEAVAAAQARLREQAATQAAEEQARAAETAQLFARSLEQDALTKETELGYLRSEHQSAWALIQSLEARVATCEDTETRAAELVAARWFDTWSAEEARQRAEKEGAALRQISSGAAQEVEHLRLAKEADEKALAELRAENSCVRDAALKFRRAGLEAEDEAKAENQARLAAETKLRDAETELRKKPQSELDEQKQRTDEDLAKRDEKLRALETEAEGKFWASSWGSASWVTWNGRWGPRWGASAAMRSKESSDWASADESQKASEERKEVAPTQDKP